MYKQVGQHQEFKYQDDNGIVYTIIIFQSIKTPFGEVDDRVLIRKESSNGEVVLELFNGNVHNDIMKLIEHFNKLAGCNFDLCNARNANTIESGQGDVYQLHERWKNYVTDTGIDILKNHINLSSKKEKEDLKWTMKFLEKSENKNS